MFFLDAIKAMAILLVTHSHLSAYYPEPEIATGGLLGNSLFFFSSAFALTIGLRRRPEAFFSWFRRRFIRIYVPLWTVSLGLILSGLLQPGSVWDLLTVLLMPQMYWFLPAIAILSVPCYLAIRYAPIPALMWLSVTGLGVHFVAALQVVSPDLWDIEDFVILKSVFYLSIMILGIYLASVPRPETSARVVLGLWVLMTLAFFGFLGVLLVTHAFYMQGIANILAYFWTIATFRALSNPGVEDFLRRRARAIVTFLGGLTLQMYLVQVPLVEWSRLSDAPFPLNLVLFWSVLIGLAVLLQWSLNSILQTTTASRGGANRNPSRNG